MRSIYPTQHNITNLVETYELPLSTAQVPYHTIYPNPHLINSVFETNLNALCNLQADLVAITPLEEKLTNIITWKFFDTYTTAALNFFTHLLSPTLHQTNLLTLKIFFPLQLTLTTLWLSLMLLLVINFCAAAPTTTATPSNNLASLHRVLYLWIYLGKDKFESIEETLSLIILWPWCILIIFTHLFSTSNYFILFGFAEWGLPVTYGLAMLVEHIWAFGLFFLTYLVGARGKNSGLITAAEDGIVSLILIIRVLLQAIRGIIVGLLHFICRELVWSLAPLWTTNFVVTAQTAESATNPTHTWYIQFLVCDILTTGISFAVITAVMFLQLLFLFISVWLFCKCWFISWHKC